MVVVAAWLFAILVVPGGARQDKTSAAPPAAAAAPKPTPTAAASPHRGLVDRYCVTCHNDRLRTAGLSLTKADTEHPSASAEVWEKVIRKLRTGAMPPTGAPRPDQPTLDGFVSYLETSIDAEAARRPDPGRPALRRLNRTEYTNAIRDLLGVQLNATASLPADDSRFGFDNVGEVLTLSPLLAERYLAVARHVRRLALGDSSSGATVERYEVSKFLLQNDRASEDLPFGSRGGVAIRHQFPADGEYIIRVRLQRDSRKYIRGMQQQNELDVRLDGRPIQHFVIGGERRGESAFVFSSVVTGDIAQEQYERNADEVLNVRQWVTAGAHQVSASFLNDASAPESRLEPRLTMYDYSQFKGGNAGVETVTIEGPFNVKGAGDSESRRRILVCSPSAAADEAACAKRILTKLARQAYRRAVTDQDLRPLLQFYESGAREGGFEAGIGLALERLLAGPEFLFRIEQQPATAAAGGAYRVSSYDLASRLSFFLWSSIPDETLLDLAERGRLHEPAVLEQQVRRMLADPRSRTLVTSFASQWLQLRNMASARPDQERFPYFDDNLRQAFITETELFFDSILREDRSVLDLMTADYTFVNERLAQHYGIPGIHGSHFRRVPLTDGPRGGLFGHGSMLTVTSYSDRTSPVIRGKWVLENILSTPPSPPPPNIPPLQEAGGQALTMRARMERHRASPACASCHRLMDPIGFALENFDGVGRYRTTDAKAPIDPSGVLPDGTAISGVAELRRAMVETQREIFVGTVTDRLLTYALGRGVEYTDAPTVRSIVRGAAPSNYKLSSLILGVVKSMPFQMKRAES